MSNSESSAHQVSLLEIDFTVDSMTVATFLHKLVLKVYCNTNKSHDFTLHTSYRHYYGNSRTCLFFVVVFVVQYCEP